VLLIATPFFTVGSKGSHLFRNPVVARWQRPIRLDVRAQVNPMASQSSLPLGNSSFCIIIMERPGTTLARDELLRDVCALRMARSRAPLRCRCESSPKTGQRPEAAKTNRNSAEDGI